MKNYYNILGVGKKAAAGEIKSAYRKLARKLHPDLNPTDPSAAERFKVVNEAYEVLGDIEKRKDYDQYGQNWRHADQIRKSGGRTGFGSPFGAGQNFNFNVSNLGDLFGGTMKDIFNQTRQPERISIDVQVTFQEAVQGTTRRLKLPDGKQIDVKIPPGIKDGGRVTLSPGGRKLLLRVKVSPDARFERVGNDIRTGVKVPLMDMLLGGEVEVDTPTGRVLLKIPPDTQNGASFKLRGKGFSGGKKGTEGDLIAVVTVVLPVPISDEQRAFFESMRTGSETRKQI